jgi:hypothetical protein
MTKAGLNKPKINLLSKALHLLLFKEREQISRKEARELEQRLSTYIKGEKNQFVNLEDVLD